MNTESRFPLYPADCVRPLLTMVNDFLAEKWEYCVVLHPKSQTFLKYLYCFEDTLNPHCKKMCQNK